MSDTNNTETENIEINKNTNSPEIDSFSEKIENLESEIINLNQKLEESENSKLRAVADLQNNQRREAENKKNWSQMAIIDFVQKALPNFLELQLAAEHSPSEDLKKIVEKFFTTLEKQGLTTIQSNPGDDIDPTIHEVLMSAKGEAGKVVQVFETGWKLNDKIITPSKISGGIHN